jgi:hypothetical protein
MEEGYQSSQVYQNLSLSKWDCNILPQKNSGKKVFIIGGITNFLK